MGVKYKHLGEESRFCLRIMLEKRYSKAKIAEFLCAHRSTIYREIKRNSWTNCSGKFVHYTNGIAHRKYIKRRKKSLKLETNPKL